MVTRFGCGLALIFSATVPLVAPALAQSSASYAQCNNEGNAFSHDAQINGCTALINSGRESGPNLAITYNNRGAAYHIKGQYDRAIADYKKAIEANPRYADAYFNRAASYRASGEYEPAIADLSSAIEINPKHAQAYYMRGMLHELRASSDYQRVLSIDPNAQHAKDALNRLAASSNAPQSGPDNSCASLIRVLGNPWANEQQKAAALEMMRSRGCLR